jgi:hypothetical protein
LHPPRAERDLDSTLAAQIGIYKAMDGGWIDAADRLTAAGT